MSTCNRLDLQTLGSQPIISKNLPDHWSTTLHIVAGHKNAIGWQFALISVRAPPTHFYLEFDGRSAYMGTHPKYDVLDNARYTNF